MTDYSDIANLNKKELADKIGVSNSRVSNWEQCINRPDADMLAEICMALNVSPSLLLNVHIAEDNYSDKERRLIQSYRNKTDLQKAIDILLDI